MALGSEARSTFLAIVKGDASQAVTEFKKLGNSVEKSTKGASGSVGKFKQLSSGAFAEVKANAGMMAAGAGAAFAGFALHAASSFSDLGVTIGKFRDSTGLAAEEASRMVELSGDLGISSDTLQATLGRLNKNIKPELFKQLGIEIATTKTGATDVQGTFLNVIDKLNGIKDPAVKAATATKLLGRNWQEISEIIGMGSAGLADRLKSITGAKVMSDDEIKKAREFRDAQDALKDVFEELVITIGSRLAPALSDAANSMANIASDAKPAIDVLGKANQVANEGTGFFSDLFDAATDIPDVLRGNAFEMELFGKKITSTGDATRGFGAEAQQAANYVDFLKGRATATASALDDDAAATKKAYDATRDLRQAMQDLNEIQLDGLATKTDAVTQYYELVSAQNDYNAKVKEGKTPVEELATAANDLAQQQADLAKAQGEASGHTQTAAERTMILMSKYNDMQATLKKGSPLWLAIEAYKQALLTIPSNINTRVTVNGKVVQDNTSGKQGANTGLVGMAAAGTPSARSGTYLVGENGPELVTMRGGERVYSNPDTARMMAGATVAQGGSNTYNVNIYPRMMPNDRELMDTLNGLTRRQGSVIP